MVGRLGEICPNIREKLAALPKTMDFGDLFSGTGCFVKVTDVLFQELYRKYPKEMDEIKVTWLLYL